MLYFVDNINRMFIEVSLDHNVENEILVFQQDIGTITSIIVDWIEDCLYYADVTNGLIGKLYKETGMKETLVTANNPRSMVMHGESSERYIHMCSCSTYIIMCVHLRTYTYMCVHASYGYNI